MNRHHVVSTKGMASVPQGPSSTVHIWGQGFKVVNGKKLPVMAGNNFFGIDDRGGWGVGSNPAYFKTDRPHEFGSNYQFKRGFSNTHLYYNIKDKASFKRVFGIEINDKIGYSRDPRNIKMLADVLFQLPGKTLRNLKKLELYDSGRSGAVAWAHTSGLIRLSNRGFSPGTFRHELGHLQDWKSGTLKSQLYASVGGHQPPYITGQGRRDYAERISTFVGGVYKSDAYWNSIIKKYPRVKGRIAVLNKMQYITMGETERILGAAGYAADPDSLAKYIREAQG